MEEKTIIKSKLINVSLIRNIIFAVGLVASVILYLIAVYSDKVNNWGYSAEKMSLFQFIFSGRPADLTWVLFIPFFGFILIGFLV